MANRFYDEYRQPHSGQSVFGGMSNNKTGDDDNYYPERRMPIPGGSIPYRQPKFPYVDNGDHEYFVDDSGNPIDKPGGKPISPKDDPLSPYNRDPYNQKFPSDGPSSPFPNRDDDFPRGPGGVRIPRNPNPLNPSGGMKLPLPMKVGQ